MTHSTITGLNSKTLTQNDPLPPLANGKLRIYNMRFFPFAQKTIMAIAHKRIDVEVVNVNLVQKPQWLLEKNPLGTVPVLEIDGRIVFDSAICNVYLDDAYPNTPRILPKDPYQASQQKMLTERLSKLTPAFYTLYQGVTDEKRNKFYEALGNCEQLLTDDYYGGKALGYADIMIWSSLERSEVLGVWYGKDIKFPDAARFPKLTAYMDRMKQEHAVKVTSRTPELHIEFLKDYVKGTPNYDIGL